ncbi:hypothetical protein SESBI_38028 [Sesbania bispinosa]|nr:hypothetical protein SESBI_38028 [Sesbania bispinosa]
MDREDERWLSDAVVVRMDDGATAIGTATMARPQRNLEGARQRRRRDNLQGAG